MKSKEVIYTETPQVNCDGGKNALGHPLVYLNITGKDEVNCPYCSRRFVLQKKQA